MVLGFITSMMPPPGAPACMCTSCNPHIQIHSTCQFLMGKLYLQLAITGQNLALFGLQSATSSSLQSATIYTGLHGLGMCNNMHVQISRQLAMSGPLPALCSTNTATAPPLVGINCTASQIHAHSREFGNGPNSTPVLKSKHWGVPYDSGRAPAGETPPAGHYQHTTSTWVPQRNIAWAQPNHP